MIARLALVLVLACSSRNDDSKQREAEALQAKADRQAAHAGMLRQRARALLGPKFFAEREVFEAQRTELAAKVGTARAELATAKTPAKKQAAQAQVDLLDAQFDELLAKAQQIGEAMLSESVRIDSLPDRCFVKPYPADCKLAPELLPDD